MSDSKIPFLCTLCGVSLSISGILQLFGGWDASLETLCIFMATDYILGILCALIWHKSPKTEEGTFESRASLKGILRKGCIMLIIIVAVRLDVMSGATNYIRNTTILFLTANEGFSIIENLGIIGLPMPDIIKNAFSSLTKK